MSASPAEILALLDRLRMDLTNAQAKITDVKRMVASLPIPQDPPKHRCGICNIARPTAEALRDHVFLVHDPDDRFSQFLKLPIPSIHTIE